MSRGNPIVQMRVDDEFLQRIDEAIESRNKHSREAPWTRSDWLRQAVLDKLSHIARSKGKKRTGDKSTHAEISGGIQ
jgi:hypothetical protein